MTDQREAPSKSHILWLGGGSCDGCTMAMLGASTPALETLLTGQVPGVPKIVLVHTALALEMGADYLKFLYHAWRSELYPYLLVLEGSVFDEILAGEGQFSGLGEEGERPVTIAEWLRRLAPGAAAVIAVGSCATWGGIPAANGNPTGAMGLSRFLGADFRCASGLPVINVPGCAPQGDAFVELLLYVFLHLAGLIPLELDAENRPRWLYQPTAYPRPPHADFLPPSAYAPEGRTHIGCPVPTRGWMKQIGGCARVGGRCIGCTMPDFVDEYLPLTRVESLSR